MAGPGSGYPAVMYTLAPLWSETRVVAEPLRLLLNTPTLRKAPRGSGTVMLIPGFKTTDRSMIPLRGWLSYLGYSAHGWGLGRNDGAVGAILPDLEARLTAIGPGPVALIGWSWGGTLARALARSVPQQVSQVITLGSPVQGGAAGTIFGRRMSEQTLEESARSAQAREAAPLPVPALSIYTPGDAVVSWQASLDPRDGQTEHLQVNSCHIGLGLNPQVWLTIAQRLSGISAGRAR